MVERVWGDGDPPLTPPPPVEGNLGRWGPTPNPDRGGEYGRN
ncbi:hypothetical protein [Okeania sp. SIO2C2]|nr:hypothetical protein [Okeania sp. SIO2C2]